MTTEQKTSDAVRITRIVSPTILIIALALIFKGEVTKMMAGGCFEIDLSSVGVGLTDKSMCSKDDIENAFEEVSTAVNERSRERAEGALNEMDQILAQVNDEKAEIQNQAMRLAEENNKIRQQAFSLAREWEGMMKSIQSQEAKMQVNRIYNEFVEVFEVPAERKDVSMRTIEPIPQTNVQEISTDIRQRYVKSTEADVKRMQENITVKRK